MNPLSKKKKVTANLVYFNILDTSDILLAIKNHVKV